MQIHIVARGFTLTETMREYVSRRLRFVLGRYSGLLEYIHVALADENWAEGGVDKSCRIWVELRGLRETLVDQVHSDIFAAIDHAADRVGRTVARRFDCALASEREIPTSKPHLEES